MPLNESCLEALQPPELLAEKQMTLFTLRQDHKPLEVHLEELEALFEELGTPEATRINLLMASVRRLLASI
jgi:hypothetical protein